MMERSTRSLPTYTAFRFIDRVLYTSLLANLPADRRLRERGDVGARERLISRCAWYAVPFEKERHNGRVVVLRKRARCVERHL